MINPSFVTFIRRPEHCRRPEHYVSVVIMYVPFLGYIIYIITGGGNVNPSHKLFYL
jgi:hypothetical protein